MSKRFLMNWRLLKTFLFYSDDILVYQFPFEPPNHPLYSSSNRTFQDLLRTAAQTRPYSLSVFPPLRTVCHPTYIGDPVRHGTVR